MLNLAGNRVREIGDLSALEGLAELNLRRNVVSRLGDDDGGGGVGGAEPTRLPPNLQRVFLSGNALRTFDALTPLRALRRLTEASVDGNPFAERGDLRGDGGGGAAAIRRRVLLTLVPIRPRSRGDRRSLRTLPGVSLRPFLAFNPRPRRLSTPSDAFQLHPAIGPKARPRDYLHADAAVSG